MRYKAEINTFTLLFGGGGFIYKEIVTNKIISISHIKQHCETPLNDLS